MGAESPKAEQFLLCDNFNFVQMHLYCGQFVHNVEDEEAIILASRGSHAAHGVVHLCINL